MRLIARQRRTDARQSIETIQAFLVQNLDDVARQLSHRRRGVPIRLDAKGIGLLLLEELRGLVQPRRHLRVHRERRHRDRHIRPGSTTAIVHRQAEYRTPALDIAP
jgi:hypothetical protein